LRIFETVRFGLAVGSLALEWLVPARSDRSLMVNDVPLHPLDEWQAKSD